MGKLLARLNKKFDHKLEQTTKLSAIAEPLRSELIDLYAVKGKNSLNTNLTACLINGLYTEQIQSFFLSVRLLQKLVSSDPNLDRQTIGSDEFKSFKAYLIKNKIIRIISDSSGFGSGERENKAAKCELIDKEIIDLLNSTKPPLKFANSDDDDDGDELERYERNLEIPELDKGLAKKIKESAAKRTKKPSKDNTLSEIDRLLSDFEIERPTYRLTVGLNSLDDNLDKIKKLCKTQNYQEAMEIITEMHQLRERLYKENSRNRFPVPLKKEIENCHKEYSKKEK